MRMVADDHVGEERGARGHNQGLVLRGRRQMSQKRSGLFRSHLRRVPDLSMHLIHTVDLRSHTLKNEQFRFDITGCA